MVSLIRQLRGVLWVLIFCGQSVWADVTANFDRDTIRINETVRLQIQSDDLSAAGEPDLSGLAQHFRILGQSSGQNISIVNGKQSATRTWTLELEPKNVGSFSIEPIAVGNQRTQALRISILPEASGAAGGSDVFVEVEADADAVYVQQQLRVTARIFVGVPVVDASVSDPEPENAVVRRLGADRNYTTTRGGREYRVFERRYAIFPQSSGELVIPPLRFQGVVDETGLGGRGFGSLFNRGKRIRSRSNAVGVTVKAPVALASGESWLPAQQVQLYDLSEPVDQYRVGEPVTIKLQLQAQGLTAEQLPEISLPTSAGLRLYPDQAEKETLDDENNVVGILLNRIAVIPQQAGELVIPGVTVGWWNVLTDSRETATLPAKTIQVAPAATASSAATPVPATVEKPRSPALQETQAPLDGVAGYWQWLAIGSLGLWLLTVLSLWFRFRSRPAMGEKPQAEPKSKEKALRSALKAACHSRDAATVRELLRQWGRKHWQREVGLDELARRIGDASLAREIERLNQCLYAPTGNASNWSGEPLWKAFDATSKHLGSQYKRAADSHLEALYPG